MAWKKETFAHNPSLRGALRQAQDRLRRSRDSPSLVFVPRRGKSRDSGSPRRVVARDHVFGWFRAIPVKIFHLCKALWKKEEKFFTGVF